MAEQKDDPGQTAKPMQSKRTTQLSGVTESFTAQDGTDGRSGSRSGSTDKGTAAVARRKQQYLIGFRSLPGMASPTGDPFLERLAQMEGVEIVRRLSGRSQTAAAASAVAAPAAAVPEILVARMDEQRGEALRQNAPPHVIVEIDAPLGYSDMAVPELWGWQHAVQTMPFPRPRRELRFRIVGEGDRPLANAVVNLHGSGFPAQALTDASGVAILQTYDIQGTGIRAVYVRPAADHWERYIDNPSIETGQVNVIRLNPLDRTPGAFPGERPYRWGQRIMKFDRISPEWSGAGSKVGIIDSGCDTSHPLLRHIVRGLDFTRDKDPQTWKSDELGQGTHCAGIVAASDVASSEWLGCAPGAEVHVFKVVPGGHFSDLIDALDQCIERRLDVVQIGVSGEQFSQLAAQKIAEARLNGIACIAASGNSGAAVQFPGNVPGVMTVTAIGKLGEYPQDTRHAQRALAQHIGFSGIYATNFSCWGPQVGVCAPGVAVVSCVPGGGFAAWDGTSMAAAHITGLSALLLAHHPMLQGINFGVAADQRVSLLNDLIRAAAIPYAQADPNHTGAGLPDLQQVPGLLPVQQQLIGGAIGAGAMLGTVAPFVYPGYLANSMNAILQLRAAGLWL